MMAPCLKGGLKTERYGIDPVFSAHSKKGLYRPTMEGQEGTFYNTTLGSDEVRGTK
jgi:hypothetical protein